jgi:predicted Fe-Mo cluster-binding NifX family protein
VLLIPLEKDEKTIALRFRKADMFVFIDAKMGIVMQENHFKTDKSALFFENFKNYDVDTLYVKELGYKTYLKLNSLGVKVSLIPEDISLYTHIEPTDLVPLSSENAELYCNLGHHNKESN